MFIISKSADFLTTRIIMKDRGNNYIVTQHCGRAESVLENIENTVILWNFAKYNVEQRVL